MNISKQLNKYLTGLPPGERTNSIYWLQKRIMSMAKELPQSFNTIKEWEAYRQTIRDELPRIIGIPEFPKIKNSFIRSKVKVGNHVFCERVDIFVDEDYSIPAFVFTPIQKTLKSLPGLVWNPGWPQDKWEVSYLKFALRMAKQNFTVLILDHAPFGESSPFLDKHKRGMTLVMGMCKLLGISQLALRAAETMRAGEYLRSRSDVDENKVAVAGLCQGGMDTWLAAALDDGFTAAAPICSESTFSIHMAEMASYMANADSSPFPFGILKVCDIQHLHAAIAPRPLLVRANLGDNWWPLSGFDVVESFTREIYRLYESEDVLDFQVEVHEHDLTGPFADALERFLLTYVK